LPFNCGHPDEHAAEHASGLVTTARTMFHKPQIQNMYILIPPKILERREYRMKNTSPKVIALLVTTILMLNMLAILAIRPATGVEELPDYEPMDWQTSQAGFQEISLNEGASPKFADGSVAPTVESFATTPPVGTKVYDWYLEAISAGTVTGTQPWMTLKAVAGNVEVWLQDYLWFPPGDARNNYDVRAGWQHGLNVTDAMCQYIADEFNNVIYPTDTTYFGAPADRDGTNTIFQQNGWPSYYWDWIATDNPQRVIIKVLNIRDTGYYNPSYPYYTVGFYSSTYTRTYYKRNMIHIDCWRWWQRLGPTGKQWFSDAPTLTVPSSRAFLMESVVAHEYQHNIHRDWNPNDPSFMNEGCSDYAQMLCGYPDTVWGHVNYYLYTPDNSLTEWGDQGDINILADYGAGLLWAVYLVDHYGGPAFLSHFVKTGIPGIAGIDAALAYYGYTQTFDDVYHDWRIANLIHSNEPGDGRYNYQSIDLAGPKAIQAFRHTISGVPVPPTKGTDFGTTWTWNGNLASPGPAYDTGIATIGPYGSDYIVMNNWNHKGIIYFDGDDNAVLGWALTADGWYSGGPGRTVNLINDLIYSDAYVNPADPTLEIVTKYDIENLWDFGFIQVSTDGGAHWTSQSNAYTTMNHDPSALAAIVAQLPGLTGQNPGYPVWTTMTFDLTAYAGQTVRIGFRYMTDSSTLGQGWWIQSATVSGTQLTLMTGKAPLDANFQVSVVRIAITPNGDIDKILVNDMELDHTSETGTKGTNVLAPSYVILVVSSISRKGVVDYTFEAKTVPIKGDVNFDGKVDIVDVSQVSAHWTGPPNGPLGYDANADLNNDGLIGIPEISIISVDWGKSW